MKKIDFKINVNDNEIDDIDNVEAVHQSDDLTDDECSNIEDHETQHERTNQNNSFYTLVDNKLQFSPHLGDLNKTYDWKTTNNHEGEIVMDYNTNAGSNTLYPRIFNALYIGQNNNCIGHLIFKLSTRQILTKMKYKPVPMPGNLFKTINGMNSFTIKIQINQSNSDHFKAQDDHCDDTKDEGQTQSNDVDNSEDES